jgi:hypothetical protein
MVFNLCCDYQKRLFQMTYRQAQTGTDGSRNTVPCSWGCRLVPTTTVSILTGTEQDEAMSGMKFREKRGSPLPRWRAGARAKMLTHSCLLLRQRGLSFDSSCLALQLNLVPDALYHVISRSRDCCSRTEPLPPTLRKLFPPQLQLVYFNSCLSSRHSHLTSLLLRVDNLL